MADVKQLILDIIARDRASQAFKSTGDAAAGLSVKVGGIGKSMTKTLTPAAAGVAVAFKTAFSEFDTGADTIRATTGATGKTLDGLTKSMKNVAVGVAEPLSVVGTAVGDINKRLGLTGKPLEGLTKQFVNLGHITGTDVSANIDAVTGLFNNFGVAADKQSGSLDTLFRASQVSGLGVAQLASQMASGGVVLREAGLSFDQSAALIAGLGKAGLDAGAVMPALGKALAVAAKDGKPAQQVLTDTFAAIKAAPDGTKAAGIALDVFGAKAGPKLAALIREGKLSFEELTNSISTGDTINAAAADTADWSEKFQMLKNRLQATIGPFGEIGAAAAAGLGALGPALLGFSSVAPVAGKVGKAIGGIASSAGSAAASVAGSAAKMVASFATTAARAVVSAATTAASWVASAATTVASFVATAAAAVASAAVTAAAWLVAAAPFIALGLVVAGVVILIIKNWDTIKAATLAVWGAIRDALSAVWAGISAGATFIFESIKTYFMFWVNGVRLVISGIGAVFGIITGAAETVGRTVRNIFDGVVGFFSGLPGRIGGVIGGLTDLITAPFKAAFNGVATIWNNTVGKLSFKIPGWVPGVGGKGFDVPDIPKFATGVTNFGGGLAYVHRDELLVNMPRGTDVIPAGAAAAGGRGDVYIDKLIQQPGQSIYELGREFAWALKAG
jgi:TP901 family phage tail tape measure protein